MMCVHLAIVFQSLFATSGREDSKGFGGTQANQSSNNVSNGLRSGRNCGNQSMHNTLLTSLFPDVPTSEGMKKVLYLTDDQVDRFARTYESQAPLLLGGTVGTLNLFPY